MTDGKNFYDEPINNLIKQYDDVRKYQQDMLMIMQQNVCKIMQGIFQRQLQTNCSWFKKKKL